jgi:hypothetical protein
MKRKPLNDFRGFFWLFARQRHLRAYLFRADCATAPRRNQAALNVEDGL